MYELAVTYSARRETYLERPRAVSHGAAPVRRLRYFPSARSLQGSTDAAASNFVDRDIFFTRHFAIKKHELPFILREGFSEDGFKGFPGGRHIFPHHHAGEVSRVEAQRSCQGGGLLDWYAGQSLLHQSNHVRLGPADIGGNVYLSLPGELDLLSQIFRDLEFPGCHFRPLGRSHAPPDRIISRIAAILI